MMMMMMMMAPKPPLYLQTDVVAGVVALGGGLDCERVLQLLMFCLLLSGWMVMVMVAAAGTGAASLSLLL